MTKNSDKVLKIKTATLDDAGTIVCKGVNGFGKAQVNIELIVLGNELFLPYLYKGATTFCPSFILSTFLNKILVHKNKDLDVLTGCPSRLLIFWVAFRRKYLGLKMTCTYF